MRTTPTATGALRRPERFEAFLLTCEADARGRLGLEDRDYPQADYLRRALKLAPDFPDALITMTKLNYEQKDYLKTRAFLQRYEAVAQHDAESLLLAYRVEMAANDQRSANKYKLLLEAHFPDSDQAQEVRRLSGR